MGVPKTGTGKKSGSKGCVICMLYFRLLKLLREAWNCEESRDNLCLISSRLFENFLEMLNSLFFLLLRFLEDYVYSFSSYSPPAMVVSPLKLADEARKAVMRRSSLFGIGLKLAATDVDLPPK